MAEPDDLLANLELKLRPRYPIVIAFNAFNDALHLKAARRLPRRCCRARGLIPRKFLQRWGEMLGYRPSIAA
jgi:hypothetical protein